MILAAGLGTRMRPISDLRAKPALPIRGRPVISLLLEFLAHHGCEEVMINLHYLPDTIRDAIAADHPSTLKIHYSEEPAPLGTGGGIRRAADFLRASEACVVLAGDMLIDVPLQALFRRHIESGRDATLLLRRDPRGQDFGTIGVDTCGDVNRIGPIQIKKPGVRDRGDQTDDEESGLFMGVRFFSREILDNWPTATADEAFEDLRDWLIPGIEERHERVGAEFVGLDDSVWEPVGTPTELLRANLTPPSLPSLGGSVDHWSGEVDLGGEHEDVVISRKATVPSDAHLERSVVWDGEQVPHGFRGHDGIYAGGRFLACSSTSTEKIH